MPKTATPLNERCTRAQKFHATKRVVARAIAERETQIAFENEIARAKNKIAKTAME
jgi:hypothetical protein